MNTIKVCAVLASLLFVCVSCSEATEDEAALAGCNSTTVGVNQQVANPISYLSSNNNGLMLQFPYVSGGETNTVTGYAIFGIGTQSNNTTTSQNITGGTTFYSLPADPNLSDNCYTLFQTTGEWGTNDICGFLDSGSNSLVFPNFTSSPISYDSNTSDATYGFYTPSPSPSTYSVTNIGYGSSSVSTPFTLQNVDSTYSSYNVLTEWGMLDSSGPINGQFDWGLPFFMGRTVFIGLQGTTSSLGSGLYWAYPTTTYTSSLTAPTGTNVMQVTIGGYTNEPYVTVTICAPGTSNCATIPNILLDTGSSGLRIFSSAITSVVANALPATGLGECISYGDNSVQWGGVQTADIQIGGQTASSVPIEVINTAFGDGGASCYGNLAAGYINAGYVNVQCPISTTAGESSTPGDPYYGCPYFDSPAPYYNGILGVNFLAQDCGSFCASNSIGLYYSCSE